MHVELLLKPADEHTQEKLAQWPHEAVDKTVVASQTPVLFGKSPIWFRDRGLLPGLYIKFRIFHRRIFSSPFWHAALEV